MVLQQLCDHHSDGTDNVTTILHNTGAALISVQFYQIAEFWTWSTLQLYRPFYDYDRMMRYGSLEHGKPCMNWSIENYELYLPIWKFSQRRRIKMQWEWPVFRFASSECETSLTDGYENQHSRGLMRRTCGWAHPTASSRGFTIPHISHPPTGGWSVSIYHAKWSGIIRI